MLPTFKLRTKKILTAITLLLLASCGGDDESANPSNPSLPGEFMECRITRTERENFDDNVYIYNDDGKLTSFDGGSSSYLYSYNGSTIEIEWYSYGDLQRTETVTVNEAGFPTKAVAVYENGVTPKRTTEFQYDAKNQLVKKTITNEGNTKEYHTVYQWFEGNMVSETELNTDDVTTYSYTDDPVQPADWFNYLDLGRGYKTIQNKNLVRKITTPSGTTYAHTYRKDDNGRIESVTITPSNNDSYTESFSYECD